MYGVLEVGPIAAHEIRRGDEPAVVGSLHIIEHLAILSDDPQLLDDIDARRRNLTAAVVEAELLDDRLGVLLVPSNSMP